MEKSKVNTDCQWIEQCKVDNFSCENCEDYTPTNEDVYLDQLMKVLRLRNIPSEDRKLIRTHSGSKYLYYDGEATLDMRYVRFINDVLKQIRKGEIDYVHKEYQLKDLLRFEPNMQVEIHNGIFYVSLSINKFNRKKEV